MNEQEERMQAELMRAIWHTSHRIGLLQKQLEDALAERHRSKAKPPRNCRSVASYRSSGKGGAPLMAQPLLDLLVRISTKGVDKVEKDLKSLER
jgi:hypothetical protein